MREGSATGMKRTFTLLLGCAFTVAALGLSQGQYGLTYSESAPSASREPRGAESAATSTLTTTIYLPLVARSGASLFSQDQPIWAHASTPEAHEVALFRHTFVLSDALQSAELYIFADTRYAAWIDGEWVGHGPARFSRKTREYDIHRLGNLSPGGHVIAVLVQWAPNFRRSESVTPILMAHIQGVTGRGFQIIARTGPEWKARLSDAWSRNAAPVHAWQLIGPTELLDLRRLPPHWTSPDFVDEEWPSAVVKSSTSTAGIVFRPRSIPLLEQVAVPITVTEVGEISPGRALVEVVPPVTIPYEFPFQVLTPTTFTIETLSDGNSPPNHVLLNGAELVWRKSGTARPDVWVASISLMVGRYILSFAEIPDQGLTFSVSTQNVVFDALPFQQGLHAGRRMLLAELVPRPEKGGISWEDGLDIELISPSTYAVLDLGRIVHGRIEATVTGPPGTVLDIGWDQRLWQGSRPLPYPGSLHKEWNQTDSWILDGTSRTISTIDTRSGRYILVTVWGSAPVRLENVKVYEERYPLTSRGAFSSPHARLNKIWQLGVETLYPNMTDAYTDTPWRERGQWWGDAYVEDHINRVAFGDALLLRRGLSYMAEAFTNGRPNALAPNGEGVHMLDYGMLWVQSLHDYWQRTGDILLLAEVYSALQEFMQYLAGYENPATGLLDIPLGHWSQTALLDWAGNDSRYGQSTAINALYYGTLLDAADLADGLGDSVMATLWRGEAESVKEQVNAYLYLPSQGRYLSSILNNAPVAPSPHAQAWALAYGLVPERERGRVASSLLALLSPDPSSPNVDIYGMFWVLEALGRTGRIGEALEIVERYYGRLLDAGATTWWETFHSDLYYSQSLAHGWAGAPTWFLTTYLLGARQLGPDSWQVKPAFWSLPQASGVLPIGEEELQLSWQAATCEEGTLEIIAPTGTQGEVVIPFTSDTTVIALNGNEIWRNNVGLVDYVERLPDGIHVSHLAGGHYLFQATQNCSVVYLPIVIH